MAITRREWLASSAVAGLSVFAASGRMGVAAATDRGAYRVKLSVAAYSFRKHLPEGPKKGSMTLLDLCDMASGWGMDAVELTSYYFTSEDKSYFHALKSKAFRLGLDISGTAIRNNFCHPDAKRRAWEIAHVKKWTDHAVEFGAPCIRIFGGNKHPEVSEQQAFRWVIEGMKESCDYAGTRGVYLAIENHGYLTGSAAEVLRIVHGVDHEWLGVNLDSGNFSSRPYDNMEELAPHAVNVQLKTDVVNDDGNGRRRGDYRRILGILRDAGYLGYVALEYEDDEDPHSGFPKFLARVRDAAGALDAGESGSATS